MAQQFLPSCINVIGESMMEWFNTWDPVFICVGLKPHPFGNERHTICFTLASILWISNIMKGKYRPTQLGQKKCEELGKTFGSCYECVSQYFQLVSLLCLTMAFLCQRGSQPCYILVYTLLCSSRSANTGPRVYQEMPLANTSVTNMLLMWICWRP